MTVSSFDPQWLGAVFLSAGAVYLGYRFIRNQKEGPELLNVPIPPEIRRTDWSGKNWDDIHGEEKRILEEQASGVSILCPRVFYRIIVLTIRVELGCVEVERGSYYELLPGRWEAVGSGCQADVSRGYPSCRTVRKGGTG